MHCISDSVTSETKENFCFFIHGLVASQNLGFLCPLKPNKKIQTEFEGNRKVALILSQQRGEHSRLMP